MDAIVAIGIMIALVALIRELTMQLCPWRIRAVERVLRRVMQVGWRCIWTYPASKLGVVTTLWLWMAGMAAVMTAMIGLDDPRGLPAMAFVWLIVFAVWAARRWWAERYFRPRDLPTRRRWRRR